MSDFPFAVICFDLDGTLVDSALDLCPAVNHALADIGRSPVAESEVRNMIGGGSDAMLRKALAESGGPVGDAEFRRLGDMLLDHYRDHIADNTVPYPGCLAALDELARLGCTLAVCTNKSEEGARSLLGRLGMTDRFAAIYGGDTLGRENAKPSGAMIRAAVAVCGGGRAAMVGDSTFDTRAASDAGVAAVALRFGYHDVPVAQLGGDVLVDHWNELVGALESL